MNQRRCIALIVLVLPFATQGCGFKSRDLIEGEESARESRATSRNASCWERSEGFKTTRTGYYKMAPAPEGLAYAGSWNFVIFPGLGIATLVMSVFTVPYDLVALPFRCMKKQDD